MALTTVLNAFRQTIFTNLWFMLEYEGFKPICDGSIIWSRHLMFEGKAEDKHVFYDVKNLTFTVKEGENWPAFDEPIKLANYLHP